MKTKCPYSYPLKSKLAIVDYLASHESYGGWNHPTRGWSPLSWNVKIGRVNTDGKQGEERVNAEFDSAWNAHVESDYELSNQIQEDMFRMYGDGDYTTYPGADQGRWKFTLAGRSGGHMILETGDGIDFLHQFDGHGDWENWLNELDYASLVKLYRAIVCMDQDFGPGKVEREFEFHLNFFRNQWEKEHAKELAMQLAEFGLEPCPVI
jgi:hypothetical protein